MSVGTGLQLQGEKLARLTARSGLLRGELRERVGVSGATIARAFAGRVVGVKTAREIAKALRVPLAEIIADEGGVP